MEELEIIEGYVGNIIFRNAENGYTVFHLESTQEDETCVGLFSFISEGQYMQLTGRYEDNPVYGVQFHVTSWVQSSPKDEAGMERYLSSGAVKGIGKALAARIVKHFKLDTFRIIEEEPERLAEVKGISEKKASDIAAQFTDQKDMRDAFVFLSRYQIPTATAVKIYNAYGTDLYRIIRENPYKLADDIDGIGFRIADEIARRAGFDFGSEFRLRAGMKYTLSQATLSGHTYLPVQELLKKSCEMLDVTPELSDDIRDNLLDALDDLCLDHELIRVTQDSEHQNIYMPYLYEAEQKSARMLLELDSAFDYDRAEDREAEENTSDSTAETVGNYISRVEEDMDITLDDLQRQAVLAAVTHGVTVITGGPGTGKTTIIRAIIRYFRNEHREISLAAPTGRAAKRMKEATDMEASTIHRLLEVSGGPGTGARTRFERDHDHPLETDVVIVDEMSMVDINLLEALLDALVPGTTLIMVGDADQLPSVGPGNVLNDLIESGRFRTVKLDHIYRQKEGGMIVENAHRINRGDMLVLDNKSQDFFFIPARSQDVVKTITDLVSQRLAGYFRVEPMDMQVLTPMRRGEAGVEKLNAELQTVLNPKAEGKHEHETGHFTFREGDKVMQIKNDYKLEWNVRVPGGGTIDSGTGVFNGDMGVITSINSFAEEVTVLYDENHEVKYPFGFLDELEPAYAVTVHKSQGSEYPVVVIPVTPGPRVLYTRNLLYTAVTRARRGVVLVGDARVISSMISNTNEQHRYSGLCDAIKEMAELKDQF